jgi:hypothetical protein
MCLPSCALALIYHVSACLSACALARVLESPRACPHASSSLPSCALARVVARPRASRQVVDLDKKKLGNWPCLLLKHAPDEPVVPRKVHCRHCHCRRRLAAAPQPPAVRCQL